MAHGTVTKHPGNDTDFGPLSHESVLKTITNQALEHVPNADLELYALLDVFANIRLARLTDAEESEQPRFRRRRMVQYDRLLDTQPGL